MTIVDFISCYVIYLSPPVVLADRDFIYLDCTNLIWFIVIYNSGRGEGRSCNCLRFLLRCVTRNYRKRRRRRRKKWKVHAPSWKRIADVILLVPLHMMTSYVKNVVHKRLIKTKARRLYKDRWWWRWKLIKRKLWESSLFTSFPSVVWTWPDWHFVSSSPWIDWLGNCNRFFCVGMLLRRDAQHRARYKTKQNKKKNVLVGICHGNL